MKKFDVKSVVMGIIAGVGITCGVGVASTVAVQNVYFSSFPIYVNGKYYSSTNPVLNYNGRTYLPLNEIGTALGGSVTFNNNTIYVSSYGNSYVDNSGDRDKVYNFTQTSEEDISIEKGKSEEYYVSLSRYGARSATITGGNSYVKVNKSNMTYSGDIKLTGVKEGKATIKITYSTGDVEKLYVEVTDDDYEEEETLAIGETYKVDIDLDEYDADEAKVTYDSDYVSVSKTKFTSDGTLKITAKKKGDTTVKIKYDSGDTVYVYLDIVNENSKKKIAVGETYKVDIDLDEYDADEAKVTYDSDYVSVSKTKFTSDGTLKITAEDEGETTVKIKYDSGDTQYIYLKIYEDDYYNDTYDDVVVSEGEHEYVYVDLDEYGAKSAEITYNKSYIKVDKTTLTSNGKIKVTGKNEGYTSIKIKFDTGDIVYIDVEVSD